MGNCFKKEILCTRQEIQNLNKHEFKELCRFVVIKITNQVDDDYKKIRQDILNESDFYICGTEFVIANTIKEKLK